MTTAEREGLLFLYWNNLDTEQINDRLDWLRITLVAGKDWGYCPEKNVCLIKNVDAAILYKLSWFSDGKQRELSNEEIKTNKSYIDNDYYLNSTNFSTFTS